MHAPVDCSPTGFLEFAARPARVPSRMVRAQDALSFDDAAERFRSEATRIKERRVVDSPAACLKR
jgi:hypothetical protein